MPIEDFSKQEVQKIILSSKTYKEVLSQLGYNKNQTKLNKIIDNFCKENNLTLDHFTRKPIKIGSKFGRWTVLELSKQTDSSGNKYYLCECSCDEKTKRIVCGNALKRGTSQSCGCLAKERSKEHNFINLKGKYFGKLFVESLDETSYNQAGNNLWNCVCECGKKCKIATSLLKNGYRIDCGNHTGERISQANTEDLTGLSFGKLTVLHKDIENWKEKQSPWICQCKCGQITSVLAGHLKSGHTTSCGKCCISTGEQKVKEIFDSLNVSYYQQYQAKELKQLRFDFAVFDDTKTLIALLECQGQQHYYPIQYFGGEERFKKQKINDNKKKQYCEKNKIPLLQIPYSDYNKIDKNYLINLFQSKNLYLQK